MNSVKLRKETTTLGSPCKKPRTLTMSSKCYQDVSSQPDDTEFHYHSRNSIINLEVGRSSYTRAVSREPRG